MYYSIKPSEHITKISNLHSSKIRRNLEFTFNSKYSLFIGSEFWDIISMFSGLFSLEEITNLIKSRHNFSQETIHSILAKLERQQVIKENDELSMWGEPIKFGSNTKLLKQYSVYFFDQDTISVDLGILLSKYDFAYLLYPQDMIITTQMVAESVFLDETNVGQLISAMFI